MQNMKNSALQYTFKVWITSILVSPVLFGLMLILRQIISLPEFFDFGFRLVGMYLVLAVLQLGLSFVTWLVFLLLVNIVSLIPLPNLLIKLIIFCIGILLTVGTFKALHDFIAMTGDGDSLINLMYANCAGIGWGVWYYKLDIKAREPMITGDDI
jgi:hypothetical protein